MTTFRRFYHVTSTVFSLKKQGLKLTKMISPKTKKQWYPGIRFEENALPSVKSLTKTTNEPGKRAVRRVAMLNKMFMKQITDIMSTGTVAMDIVGRGIEISKVTVTPDFQTVNVFWVCKGNSTDEETELALKKVSGALRHELSTLRVMGVVPHITFVKDKQEALVADLDRRLAIADYGEDYEATEMGHLLKTNFTLNKNLSPEMKAKIKQVEEEMSFIDDPIPEMTHNVFGLDHARIMNRLLAARKKSRDAWVNIDVDNPVISYRTSDTKPDITDLGNQQQDLADFLLKRQILQNKLRKELRSGREDWLLQPTVTDDDDPTYDSEEDDDYYYDDDDYYYYEESNLNQDHKDDQKTV
ncbi:putative ribosome-binding factor A, mitochondrial [Ostrinia nubilalis]|uniref:putative ribosome-binding factor A, mitochondrial n=1 Tax=Ostrinia nubilalis TaxID=29057 RepID=UPI0030824769